MDLTPAKEVIKKASPKDLKELLKCIKNREDEHKEIAREILVEKARKILPSIKGFWIYSVDKFDYYLEKKNKIAHLKCTFIENGLTWVKGYKTRGEIEFLSARGNYEFPEDFRIFPLCFMYFQFRIKGKGHGYIELSDISRNFVLVIPERLEKFLDNAMYIVNQLMKPYGAGLELNNPEYCTIDEWGRNLYVCKYLSLN